MASLQQKFSDLIYLVSNRRPKRGRPAAAPSLTGSQDPVLPGGRPHRRNQKFFDLPEPALRPIMLDRSLTMELLEMSQWSPEASGSMTILAQNIFQADTGDIGSWKIRTKNPDGTPMDNPPHPNVVAIAESLRTRYNGKNPILGAQRLERAAWCVALGDQFMELAISKEGIGRNDYGISDSIYLPAFSTFIEANQQGAVESYRQQSRIDAAESDRVWSGVDMARILHFKHRGHGQRYGDPRMFPQIEAWRKVKEVAADLEAASRSVLLPTLHIMSENRDENFRAAYRAEHQALQEMGIITDMYLPYGADVRKVSAPTPSLKPLLDYYLVCRYQCLMVGIPIFLIPGLAIAEGTSKELGQHPAMNYARLLSHTRSILAEQLKWCVALETTLNYGYEFWIQNSDIEFDWPAWQAIPDQPGLMTKEQMKPPAEKEQEAKEKFVNVNEDKAKRLFGSV